MRVISSWLGVGKIPLSKRNFDRRDSLTRIHRPLNVVRGHLSPNLRLGLGLRQEVASDNPDFASRLTEDICFTPLTPVGPLELIHWSCGQVARSRLASHVRPQGAMAKQKRSCDACHKRKASSTLGVGGLTHGILLRREIHGRSGAQFPAPLPRLLLPHHQPVPLCRSEYSCANHSDTAENRSNAFSPMKSLPVIGATIMACLALFCESVAVKRSQSRLCHHNLP